MTDKQNNYIYTLGVILEKLNEIKEETYVATAPKKYTEDKALYESMAKIQNLVLSISTKVGNIECNLWRDWNE